MSYTLTGRKKQSKEKFVPEVEVRSSYEVPWDYRGKKGIVTSKVVLSGVEYSTVKDEDGKSFLVPTSALVKI